MYNRLKHLLGSIKLKTYKKLTEYINFTFSSFIEQNREEADMTQLFWNITWYANNIKQADKLWLQQEWHELNNS